MIRNAILKDASGVAAIYSYYILKTVATFEKEPVSELEMAERIKVISTNFPYLVYVEGNEILGYAYATKWRAREAYKQTVEVSVYLRNGVPGKGIGTALYEELFARLRGLKIHAVIGGVSLPNEASVRLHQKFGFEKVAHFKEVGFKFDTWVDVGYWEMFL